MGILHLRSIIIILSYVGLNFFIVAYALKQRAEDVKRPATAKSLLPEFTVIERLDYFHLRERVPQMSLSASEMKSQEEDYAEFTRPQGLYNYIEKNKLLKYSALRGVYRKPQDLLVLHGEVQIKAEDGNYQAGQVKYYFKKDLIYGFKGVEFQGQDLKTLDRIKVEAERMKANLKTQLSRFQGGVKGEFERKKKYEGKMTFASQTLDLDGVKSLAHLEGSVELKRGNYNISAGNGDIYLENYNKTLKYFVFNDDVKVTEKIEKPVGGVLYRKAYAERLEGFGRENKMILSGAPKLEQGTDVIKGYRITIRENMDLVEVDDAMSDVKVKKESQKKN
jgi:lipopolysaccharide export system protein LptA